MLFCCAITVACQCSPFSAFRSWQLFLSVLLPQLRLVAAALRHQLAAHQAQYSLWLSALHLIQSVFSIVIVLASPKLCFAICGCLSAVILCCFLQFFCRSFTLFRRYWRCHASCFFYPARQSSLPLLLGQYIGSVGSAFNVGLRLCSTGCLATLQSATRPPAPKPLAAFLKESRVLSISCALPASPFSRALSAVPFDSASGRFSLQGSAQL